MNMIVLAGGESRRMGQAKALLPYQGRPFITYLTDQVLSVPGGTGSCIVVTRSELLDSIQSVVDTRIQVIVDVETYKGLGPLAGMYSGMQQQAIKAISKPDTTTSADWFAVLACDMPFFSVPLLLSMEKIASQNSDSVDAVVFPNQPFHGFYHTRIMPVLKDCLTNQQLSFRELFTYIRIHELPFDPELTRTFFNMNTPGDYQELLRDT